jgi:hypothetical protein
MKFCSKDSEGINYNYHVTGRHIPSGKHFSSRKSLAKFLIFSKYNRICMLCSFECYPHTNFVMALQEVYFI